MDNLVNKVFPSWPIIFKARIRKDDSWSDAVDTDFGFYPLGTQGSSHVLDARPGRSRMHHAWHPIPIPQRNVHY